jgi:purine-binding chemotaxis protein CheW
MRESVKSGEDNVTVADDDRLQHLTFMLQGEVFAIAILHIKEIMEYGHLTAVPMMPDFISGVINLRGAVVPVVDLSARFGGKRTDITKRTCIVIIEVAMDDESHVIGVIVDAVNEVLEIEAEEIEPPPAFGAKIRADFIQGMGKINGEFVIILSVAKLLSTANLNLLEEAERLVESAA